VFFCSFPSIEEEKTPTKRKPEIYSKRKRGEGVWRKKGEKERKRWEREDSYIRISRKCVFRRRWAELRKKDVGGRGNSHCVCGWDREKRKGTEKEKKFRVMGGGREMIRNGRTIIGANPKGPFGLGLLRSLVGEENRFLETDKATVPNNRNLILCCGCVSPINHGASLESTSITVRIAYPVKIDSTLLNSTHGYQSLQS